MYRSIISVKTSNSFGSYVLNAYSEKVIFMRKNDPVSKIMATSVETVQDGQALSQVRHLMSEQGIHHVPVLSGKKLVGLVSFTDMMKLSLVLGGATEHTIDTIIDQQFSIKEVMSTRLKTLSDKDTVREAAEKLSEGGFHSLPVVSENGDLVGIVTSTDLIRYLTDQY
jgi:CBS-domain-containing membrane protein